MIISISQPAYLPWLGYYDRILKSDLHVMLDDVMLERSSKTRFTNRNKILNNENVQWVTVPVLTSGLGQPLICETVIDNSQNWASKHHKTISQSYSKSRYFNDYRHILEEIYYQKYNNLFDLLYKSNNIILSNLNINPKIIKSSDLNITGKKSDYILNICKYLGAKKYLSGPFGKAYLDSENFESMGIEIIYQNYKHPNYTQLSKNFVSNLSILDLLFNNGIQSLGILENNHEN